MTQARINSKVLKWARGRLNISSNELAHRLRLSKPDRLYAWEDGKEYPTFRQAQELAKVLRIPLGYLFLSEPPLTALGISDFRTIPGTQAEKFSIELEDVLNDAYRKRDWLRERRIQDGQPPLAFVGSFSENAFPKQISDDIRRTLELPSPTAKDTKSNEEHLNILVRQAEQVGIIVLQSGHVGSNTRRTLSVEEFRGFVLADPYAPLIFINARDFVNGRIFTFAHELVHIWTGTTGVSNPQIHPFGQEQNRIEVLCNQAAAELLVPEQYLNERWQNHSVNEVIQQLTNECRVSKLVILIRAYETGLLSKSEFQLAYSQARQEIEKVLNEKTSSDKSGGNFYRTLQKQNGQLLLTEIAQALREGSILHQEASRLLNVSLKTLENALDPY